MKSFCQYLTEVSKDQLDNVGNLDDDRPFDNIFGDKTRIVIPLRKERSDYSFINTLAQKGYSSNLETGMVTYPVYTFKCKKCGRKFQSRSFPEKCSCGNKTPWHGMDTERAFQLVPNSGKKRQERIGTVLSKLNKQEPERGWDELLHWWEKNKGVKVSGSDDTGISIIISRSPIDIIRMSDHREFNSCHSPPGSKNTTAWKSASHFHCSTQEARTGGGVAYAIRTADLKKVKDLQATEIFLDRDRNIKGIEPLQRQKLRRFTDGGIDLLIPEPKTYGIAHVDFQETILDFLRTAQKDLVDFSNPPPFKKFKLRGGSYQDVKPASTLWNKFFGTHETGDRHSMDEKEEGEGHWTPERLETMADKTYAEHSKKWKNSSVWYEVENDGDGGAYIYSNGSIVFEFDSDLVLKVPDENDLRISYAYRKDDFTPSLGDALKDVLEINSENIMVSEHEGKFRLIVDIRSDNAEGRLDQPPSLNEFESLLDDIDTIEEKYDEHYTAVMQVLMEHGVLKNWWEDSEFKNFNIDKETYAPQIMAVSEPIWIGDIKGINKESIGRKRRGYYEYNGTAIEFTNKTYHSNAGVIFPFSTISPDYLQFQCDVPIQEYLWSNDPVIRSNPVYDKPYKVYLQLWVPLLNKKILHTVKSIDQRFDYYTQRATQWWNTIKPGLCDVKDQAFSPKIPFARKFPKIQKQNKFDFMDDDFEEWLRYREKRLPEAVDI